MTAYEQRSYPGAAADTLLNADLASNGLTFSVTPGTGNGYPDGSGGPFFVAIDYDTSKAEKVRVTSRINDTFTVTTTGDRGVDGTSAQAHAANAKVRAVWTATDAQEANRAAANTVGKVTTKGDLLAATAANSLGRVSVGADTAPLVADSTQSTGVRFDSAAWTTYIPTWTARTSNPSNPGDLVGRYKQVGKTVHYEIYWQSQAGSNYGVGAWVFSLPTNIQNDTRPRCVGAAVAFDAGGSAYAGVAYVPTAGGNDVEIVGPGNNKWDATHPFVFGANLNQRVMIAGTYESS